MRLVDAYPVIVTERLAECRDFYTQRLGFGIIFEATWFVYLASAGEPARGVAFMRPDHPSQPPGPERFSGEGMFLTLQVLDAAAELARLREAGVPIVYPLRDEPWGAAALRGTRSRRHVARHRAADRPAPGILGSLRARVAGR